MTMAAVGITVERHLRRNWNRYGGNKIITTRLNLQAVPGSTVNIFGYDYLLSAVYCVPVLDACRRFYDDEGFKDAAEMAADLFTIYKGLKFKQLVFVHEYRRLRCEEMKEVK